MKAKAKLETLSVILVTVFCLLSSANASTLRDNPINTTSSKVVAKPSSTTAASVQSSSAATASTLTILEATSSEEQNVTESAEVTEVDEEDVEEVVLDGDNAFALKLSKDYGTENDVLFAVSAKSDMYLAFFVDFCENPAMFQTYLHSVTWITDRLNTLKYFTADGLKLGYLVFRTCDESDMLSSVFRLHREKQQYALLGIVVKGRVSSTVKDVCDVLKITLLEIQTLRAPMVQAAVSLVNSLDWQDNLTVVATDPSFLDQFYEEARKEFICVTNGLIYSSILTFHHTSISKLVIFASAEEIKNILSLIHNNVKLIAVPTDGQFSEDLPDVSYIIKMLQIDYTQPYKRSSKILPSSAMLEAAITILKIAEKTEEILSNTCNDTSEKVTCLKSTAEAQFEKRIVKTGNEGSKLIRNNVKHQLYVAGRILELLDIRPIQDKFVYDIFTVQHLSFESSNATLSRVYAPQESAQVFSKIGTYGIINQTITFEEKTAVIEIIEQMQNQSFPGNLNNLNSSCWNGSLKSCYQHCLNFKFEDTDHPGPKDVVLMFWFSGPVHLRREAWVLAVLTIAVLGVTLCLAILFFLIISICRRDSLEGNPTLTVFLLVAVVLTYLGVTPFALTTEEKDYMEKVCMARAFSVTMTYTTVLSLMLSRCILLASVAVESEFMSHIPGPVQAMLCLLMVAVQAALNVQLVAGSCQELMSGDGYIYFLAYDVLLLATSLCCMPLVVKSQRNYREGKYFMVTVVFLIVGWTLWICAFLLLDDEWNDLVLCSGLLYTASVCLGTIFIPRTYLMTSALTRDRLTGTFPSLATSSALDLYHTPGAACHVYDCVNVTAVNAAVAASRNNTMTNGTINALNNANSAQTLRISDIYEPPVHIMEGDVDGFSMHESNSVSTDKITRF